MDRFLNAIKAQSGAMDRATAQPRFGVVTSVDPTRPAARVALQPEGVISGWLPILSPCVGAGWGLSCPPSPGDQVFVVAQEGDAEHGVIIGRAWSDTARTPQTPPGEIWLFHKTGSFIKLVNDGSIQLQGNTTLTGNLFVTGTIHGQTDILADRDIGASRDMTAIRSMSDGIGTLDRLRQHYDAHTHADPQGGTVGSTTQPD